MSVNLRRDPCIGYAQDGAPGLQCAHTNDLQALSDCQAAFKPGKVAWVEQQRGRWQPAADFLAGEVFMANQRSDALYAEGEWRLVASPRAHVFKRNIERTGEPAKARWTIFIQMTSTELCCTGKSHAGWAKYEARCCAHQNWRQW